MVGLETALSVVQAAMVDTGLLDWAGVAERMSAAPARIGAPRRPRAARSRPARRPTSSLVDPAARARRRPRRMAHGKAATRPYRGRELPGRVVATFLRGRPTVLDGAARRAPRPTHGRRPAEVAGVTRAARRRLLVVLVLLVLGC